MQFRQALHSIKPNKKRNSNNGGDDSYDNIDYDDMEDRKECPYCGRKFNKDVAEKHIPICKDIKNKPTTLKKGGGNYNKVLQKMSNTPPASKMYIYIYNFNIILYFILK